MCPCCISRRAKGLSEFNTEASDSDTKVALDEIAKLDGRKREFEELEIPSPSQQQPKDTTDMAKGENLYKYVHIFLFSGPLHSSAGKRGEMVTVRRSPTKQKKLTGRKQEKVAARPAP